MQQATSPSFRFARRPAGNRSFKPGAGFAPRGGGRPFRSFGKDGGGTFIKKSGSSFGNRGNSRFGGSSRGNRFSVHIDISKFIYKAADQAETAPEVIVNTFADFDLVPELQSNIKYKKYETPTPIQDRAIKPIIEGKDIVGLANTGTGKTAAFLLPMISKMFKDRTQKLLIIAPTRELALQIDSEFRQFAWNMRLNSAACVGGAPMFRQINDLRRTPNCVIGTPGRLKDLSERGHIQFDTFNNVVIDEIDRMLDMGFIDDIREMLRQLPSYRQSLFFSATMPPKIRDIVKQFIADPIIVEIKGASASKSVDQDVVRVRDKSEKLDQLKDLLRQEELNKVLVFNETRHDVERLTTELITAGFKADSIHGGKRQSQRQRALLQFKNGHVDILVATDVAARGLDIDNVSHVISYTLPKNYDDYVHRIGRTGRGNKKGKALTFVDVK